MSRSQVAILQKGLVLTDSVNQPSIIAGQSIPLSLANRIIKPNPLYAFEPSCGFEGAADVITITTSDTVTCSFQITGLDQNNVLFQEIATITSGTTVNSTNVYSSIYSIIPLNSAKGTVQVKLAGGAFSGTAIFYMDNIRINWAASFSISFLGISGTTGSVSCYYSNIPLVLTGQDSSGNYQLLNQTISKNYESQVINPSFIQQDGSPYNDNTIASINFPISGIKFQVASWGTAIVGETPTVIVSVLEQGLI